MIRRLIDRWFPWERNAIDFGIMACAVFCVVLTAWAAVWVPVILMRSVLP